MPENRKRTDRDVAMVSLPKAATRVIDRAAARRHKSRSAFMRDAAVAEANRVLGIEADAPVTTPASAIA